MRACHTFPRQPPPLFHAFPGPGAPTSTPPPHAPPGQAPLLAVPGSPFPKAIQLLWLTWVGHLSSDLLLPTLWLVPHTPHPTTRAYHTPTTLPRPPPYLPPHVTPPHPTTTHLPAHRRTPPHTPHPYYHHTSHTAHPHPLHTPTTHTPHTHTTHMGLPTGLQHGQIPTYLSTGPRTMHMPLLHLPWTLPYLWTFTHYLPRFPTDMPAPGPISSAAALRTVLDFALLRWHLYLPPPRYGLDTATCAQFLTFRIGLNHSGYTLVLLTARCRHCGY